MKRIKVFVSTFPFGQADPKAAELIANQGWELGFANSLKLISRVGIGLGRIGKTLSRLLKPFDCKILVNDIKPDEEFIRKNNLVLLKKELIIREGRKEGGTNMLIMFYHSFNSGLIQGS